MIPVYVERHGNRWTHSRQRRYWLQSSEAEAAGFPYISIRPRGRHARVVCDWITAGRRAPDPFARLVAEFGETCRRNSTHVAAPHHCDSSQSSHSSASETSEGIVPRFR